MFGARHHHGKRDQREAEEFVHRLAEVRADMDRHPPTINDGREVATHLRHVHIGAQQLHAHDHQPTVPASLRRPRRGAGPA